MENFEDLHKIRPIKENQRIFESSLILVNLQNFPQIFEFFAKNMEKEVFGVN